MDIGRGKLKLSKVLFPNVEISIFKNKGKNYLQKQIQKFTGDICNEPLKIILQSLSHQDCHCNCVLLTKFSYVMKYKYDMIISSIYVLGYEMPQEFISLITSLKICI